MKSITITLTEKTAKQILQGQIKIEGNNRIRNLILRQITDQFKKIQRQRLAHLNRISKRIFQITPRVIDHSDA